MDVTGIAELIKRHTEGEITVEESAKRIRWRQSNQANEALFQLNDCIQ